MADFTTLRQSSSSSVFRLSGTGTQGATVRAYFERYAPADTALDLPPKPR
ncbi:MAG: hypothetical protein P8Q57_06210 [Yoonia sp.]|nr:hypothetical protein [Yoonia sp.]